MLPTVSNVWKVLLVKKTFISAAVGRFRTYLPEAPRFVNYCYVGQVLDDVHTELVCALTDRYGVCEDVGKGRVVVSRNKMICCAEEFCYVYRKQVQI